MHKTNIKAHLYTQVCFYAFWASNGHHKNFPVKKKGSDVADFALNNSKDSRHKPESTRKDARFSKDFCFVQPA